MTRHSLTIAVALAALCIAGSVRADLIINEGTEAVPYLVDSTVHVNGTLRIGQAGNVAYVLVQGPNGWLDLCTAHYSFYGDGTLHLDGGVLGATDDRAGTILGRGQGSVGLLKLTQDGDYGGEMYTNSISCGYSNIDGDPDTYQSRIEISGDDSVLDVAGDLVLGVYGSNFAGEGEVLQTGGTVTISNYLNIGSTTNSQGLYTISGGTLVLTGSARDIRIGGTNTAAGTGTLHVKGSGVTSITVPDRIYLDAGSTLKYTIDAGGVTPINVQNAYGYLNGIIDIDLEAGVTPAVGTEYDLLILGSGAVVDIGDVTQPTGEELVWELVNTEAGKLKAKFLGVQEFGDTPDAATSTVVADPTSIPDAGYIESTLTITLKDDQSRLVPDIPPEDFLFDLTGGGTSTFGTVTEAGDGIYTVTFTNDTPGDHTITVTIDMDPDPDVELDQEPTVTVYDASLVDADASSVTVNPAAIEADGVTTSTITIQLNNPDGLPVDGVLATEITVLIDAGAGPAATATGSTGEFTATYASAVPGDKVVSVEVDSTEGGTATLTDTPTITVYTPGTNGFPLADAGDDVEVTDSDRTGREEVTLDGSASSDSGGANPGLVNYLWTLGDVILYDGANSVTMAELAVGVHEVLLTVEDGDGNLDQDEVTITVHPPEGDTVALDISGEFNFDAVGTPAEMDVTAPWYDYYLVEDSARVIYATYYNRSLRHVYVDPAAGFPYADQSVPATPVPEGDDEWYLGRSHHFIRTYTDNCFYHSPYDITSLQSTIVTEYGVYELGPFDAGAALETLQNTMPAQPNAIRLGTSTYWNDGSRPDAGYAEKTVMLPVGQQRAYQDVNFLVSGHATGNCNDTTGRAYKRSWFQVYAIYQGEGGSEEENIFCSPRVQMDATEPYGPGDPLNDIAGGVPSAYDVDLDGESALWDPDWMYNAGTGLGWKSVDVGSNTVYNASGAGDAGDPNKSMILNRSDGKQNKLWEPRAAGIALNSGKTLLGFKFVMDNGPSTNLTGSSPGETVNIYAACATPAAGEPLEIDAELAAGEDWVYQNTETTTDDRHTSLATITLVSEASPGEVYNVSIADDGPGTNFTLGAVTDNRPGDQTLIVPIVGGRIGSSTPGASGAAYTVTLTVEGQTSTQSDTADVSLALRYIGDVDGSGAPGAQDKQFFNQRLNNVATAYPDRCYDLNGSGGAPNAEDKQVMNQVLNGVSLP